MLSLLVTAFVPFPGNPSEKTRQTIALRYIGDQLLRQSGDRSSRVLPIVEPEAGEFVIGFEKPFSFVPDSLVGLFVHQARIGSIASEFSVEAIDKETGLTAYAFGFPSAETPCLGRANELKKYELHVRFGQQKDFAPIWFAGIPFALFFLVLGTRHPPQKESRQNDPEGISIGKYQFYPDSNQLKIGGKTVSLTTKESNVLHIFALRPNEAIEREILQKEVWESKGVIVGRSLDVFISRLRKKLAQDDNLKITSLHGTGYKLIVTVRP